MKPASISQFKAYMDGTPAAITQTHQSSRGVAAAQAILQKARRIFFSGSGSSVPAALLGQQLLARYTDRAGIFAPSSLLLDGPRLTTDDVIVLVTQGWNRADAALITRGLLDTKATLIVVTGRPDRLELYRDIPAASQPIRVAIFPTIEKIFCRPATAITGYIKIAQLLEPLTGVRVSEQDWQAAYHQGQAGLLPMTPLADKRYIILASSLLLCAGNNVALSLREGAGRYGSLHEIESYGHGQYVPDQLAGPHTHYIILTGQPQGHPAAALRRIQPLLDTSHSSYEIWDSQLDSLLANVTFMAHTAQIVYADISRTRWDMNNPPGMEGNRSFHEVWV